MDFTESLSIAAFLLLVVFSVLTILLFIVKLFSYAITRFIDTTSNNGIVPMTNDTIDTTIAERDIFSSGTLKLVNIDEPTAAIIMAIVSDESGIPLSELCFKSIRLINNSK